MFIGNQSPEFSLMERESFFNDSLDLFRRLVGCGFKLEQLSRLDRLFHHAVAVDDPARQEFLLPKFFFYPLPIPLHHVRNFRGGSPPELVRF